MTYRVKDGGMGSSERLPSLLYWTRVPDVGSIVPLQELQTTDRSVELLTAEGALVRIDKANFGGMQRVNHSWHLDSQVGFDKVEPEELMYLWFDSAYHALASFIESGNACRRATVSDIHDEGLIGRLLSCGSIEHVLFLNCTLPNHIIECVAEGNPGGVNFYKSAMEKPPGVLTSSVQAAKTTAISFMACEWVTDDIVSAWLSCTPQLKSLAVNHCNADGSFLRELAQPVSWLSLEGLLPTMAAVNSIAAMRSLRFLQLSLDWFGTPEAAALKEQIHAECVLMPDSVGTYLADEN